MLETIVSMSKVELSLLLYVESCCCDFGGLLDPRRVNKEELELLTKWNDEDFISFSRLTFASLSEVKNATHAVTLSEKAWGLAHAERRARFKRVHTKRTWQTTAELRAN